MAFKMNKSVFNFGEMMDMQKKRLDKRYQLMSDKIGEEKAGKYMKAMHGYEPTPTASAEGTAVSDPGTQDAGDPNLEAKKAAKGGGGFFGGIGKAVRGDGSLKERLRGILQELENK